MSELIHSTAVVDPGARIGSDCRIGPYCIVGEHVTIGDRCHLHSHVVLGGHTVLGNDNEVFPFATIGLKSQDLKWAGGTTWVRIGDRNNFREYVTVHSATGDGDSTIIGSDNHILAYCHIAHDVRLGNRIIMSNVATLAGHVEVEDHAIIGGLAAVHQFCRIGSHAMIGGCSKIVQDIPPFHMADGNPGVCRTINKVGMERSGFSGETIRRVNHAFKVLIREGLTMSNALAKLESESDPTPEVAQIVRFIKASQRGIAR